MPPVIIRVAFVNELIAVFSSIFDPFLVFLKLFSECHDEIKSGHSVKFHMY